MAVITYTATKELTDAGNENTIQELEFALVDYQEPTAEPIERRRRSLGGLTQVYLYRVDRALSVVATGVREAHKPKWREFFSSVAGGHTFVFTPRGTIADPGEEEHLVALAGGARLHFQRVGNGDKFHVQLNMELR